MARTGLSTKGADLISQGVDLPLLRLDLKPQRLDEAPETHDGSMEIAPNEARRLLDGVLARSLVVDSLSIGDVFDESMIA